MERADGLAAISEEPARLTRRFATAALKLATNTVAGWMRAAGMQVRHDNVGNLVGRYEGAHGATKTLLLGSHLDSVRDAGKYDGPLGVLVALACVERLNARELRLPFAIEVFAFADEEGLRYHTAYLGSNVVAGSFDPTYLSLVDADGIALADAIRAFGGDPAALTQDARRPDDVLGYCEVHIEQGPVLEALDLPVGIVTAIAGQSRLEVTWQGQAGHAGTVPMHLRRDALCAAAEFMLSVEQLAEERAGSVATVGQIAAEPGASNVIPGRVTLSLDVRHQDDALREQALEALHDQAFKIATRRHVVVQWQTVQESRSVLCSPWLIEQLERAIEHVGYAVHHLPSGAGHDAVVMAGLTDVAMLFVRCKAGVSHHPAESVMLEDVAAAIAVLESFLASFASDGPTL
ncbi:MAG: allantoate amidohydrolase [Chloroflexi bacterium]|nr:MAG: allantoate amidohydrolase [Chloroflexota bacterium]